jgi:hypothetical protein
MSKEICESTVEEATLAWLESLGYAVLSKSIFDMSCAQDDENPFGRPV